MEPNYSFWDNMAKRYPRFNDISMSKDVNHILAWCQNRNVLFDGASILDIGAGTGTIAIPLAQKGAQVTAMDISVSMLAALNEDAIEQGISAKVSTHQSDWDSFPLLHKYDIVIASMTPAISDPNRIEKMISASHHIGIYVGWGKYRTNKFVSALMKAHHVKDASTSADCAKASHLITTFTEKNIAYESGLFETSWTDEYTFEDAKTYAYDQLKRRNITPDLDRVEEVLAANTHGDKVLVQIDAEKEIILWKVA